MGILISKSEFPECYQLNYSLARRKIEEFDPLLEVEFQSIKNYNEKVQQQKRFSRVILYCDEHGMVKKIPKRG